MKPLLSGDTAMPTTIITRHPMTMHLQMDRERHLKMLGTLHVPPADTAFQDHRHSATDESLYPWKDDQETLAMLDPLIAKTLALRANYLLNIKYAKNDLLIHANCPPFPDGLWTDILLDRYIDLNCVFTGYYSIDSDNHHTQSLGDIELIVNSGNSAKPNETVKNHDEWAIAFVATRAAVLFAYPHRSWELSEYKRYIIGQFAAILNVTQHPHVITLDWAI